MTEPNLHIADTDYTSYAINYQCDTANSVVRLWIDTREPVVSDEFFNSVFDKAMQMFPSFDQSTLQPRLTQGDMCSYHQLSAQTPVSAVYEFLATHSRF